jgi:hypothetical protein
MEREFHHRIALYACNLPAGRLSVSMMRKDGRSQRCRSLIISGQMPQMVCWPFMVGTMIEDGFCVKALPAGAAAALS